jgi:hypothetical protein
MGKKMFLEIVLLIFVNAFAMTFIKCMHDKFCKVCKK